MAESGHLSYQFRLQPSFSEGGSDVWNAYHGEKKVAEMVVGKWRGIPETTVMPSSEFGHDPMEAYTPTWHRFFGNEPARLFHVGEGEPPTHRVSSLYSTKAHRLAVPQILAMAENRAQLQTGQSLLPSRDLSRYSSRLVGGLQRRGAVSSEHPTEVSNQSRFIEPDYLPEEIRRGRLVTGPELAAGRQTLRQLLRGDRPREVRGQQKLF